LWITQMMKTNWFWFLRIPLPFSFEQISFPEFSVSLNRNRNYHHGGGAQVCCQSRIDELIWWILFCWMNRRKRWGKVLLDAEEFTFEWQDR
jgi:hypothetical protein